MSEPANEEAFWEREERESMTGTVLEVASAGVLASREMTVKKKRAMETLFVECVEGKPYSRWWFPIARPRHR